MLLDSSPRFLTTSVAYAVVAAVIGKLAWQWFRLRRVPGPFLAKLTNLPRAYWVWSRRAHDIHIGLHEKYGHLVRFGPNMVSVGNAQEVDKVYRMHNPLAKVCYYFFVFCKQRMLTVPSVRLLSCYSAHVQGQDSSWSVRNPG
jgi:hypothetical protein